MPIYEYKCPKCGVFEAIQNFSEKPLKCKPDCQEKSCPKKAERLISQSAFHLKGSGWYKTDYSSGSSAKSSSSSSPAADSGSDSSSSDSGSDSGGEKKEGKKEKGDKKKGALKQAKCGSGCGCH